MASSKRTLPVLSPDRVPITIQPYTEEWIPAVRAFNQRLIEGGSDPQFIFPESHIPEWLPPSLSPRLHQLFYLATSGSDVHGGFILKPQEFAISGSVKTISHYRLPLSEGLVNKAWMTVGAQMLRSAQRMQPHLFALGMGSADRPLPRMLRGTGWSLAETPFFFRVLNASRFLLDIRPLQSNPVKRIAARIAASTGAGWLGLSLIQNRSRKRSDRMGLSVELVRGFGEWADQLWQECRTGYDFIAVRDSGILNLLYPASDDRFLCLKIMRKGKPIGWTVLLDTAMHDHRYFGNLRTGTLVDGLAALTDVAGVVECTAEFFRERGVDLIISNQSHAAWVQGLRDAGFLTGPSNYLLAVSKPLAAAVAPFEERFHQFHINRGDGDGPIHL